MCRATRFEAEPTTVWMALSTLAGRLAPGSEPDLAGTSGPASGAALVTKIGRKTLASCSTTTRSPVAPSIWKRVPLAPTIGECTFHQEGSARIARISPGLLGG